MSSAEAPLPPIPGRGERAPLPPFPVPSLVVLVGPSGSGKTTWARKHFAANETVSLADLKAAVGRNELDTSATVPAYELADRIVTERLGRGLRVVVDSEGLDAGRRARWMSAAATRGVPAYAVLFATDVELCLERNAARSLPRPETFIRRQSIRCAEIEPEIRTEGYRVFVVA